MDERLITDKGFKHMATALLVTVGARDPDVRSHCEHVALLAVDIAAELGLPHEDVDNIWLASIIHDVGKVGIPWEILHKPGVLNKLERDLVEAHVETSLNILRESRFPPDVLKIVGQHHERLDGSGYPHRLKGAEIILGARVLCVADIFDAMTTERPYRRAFSIEQAQDYLEQHKGKLFHSPIVDAIKQVVTNKGLLLPR